jgi:hypothetical protein
MNTRKRLIAKIIASLIISHIIIMIGRSDWLSVLGDWLYFKDLIITFISVFIVFEYVDWITHRLNHKLSWLRDFPRRLLLQVIFAVFIPSLLAILITFLQSKFIYDQDFIETGYFNSEFPTTILLIVIVNLLFLVNYLFETSHTATSPKQVIPQTNLIMAKKGNKNIPVSLDEIAYISLISGVLFITTISNEKMTVLENLEYYERCLPEDLFFRANRQTIVNRKACESYRAIDNGKIGLNLKIQAQDQVIISQKRAAKFRLWIKGPAISS